MTFFTSSSTRGKTSATRSSILRPNSSNRAFADAGSCAITPRYESKLIPLLSIGVEHTQVNALACPERTGGASKVTSMTLRLGTRRTNYSRDQTCIIQIALSRQFLEVQNGLQPMCRRRRSCFQFHGG